MSDRGRIEQLVLNAASNVRARFIQKEKIKSPETVWSLLSLSRETRPMSSVISHCHISRDIVDRRSCSRLILLTGIFFCAMATTQSLPRMATVVKPPWLIALKAYSTRRDPRVSGTDLSLLLPPDTYRLGRVDLRVRRWWYHDRNRRKLFDSLLRDDLKSSFSNLERYLHLLRQEEEEDTDHQE